MSSLPATNNTTFYCDKLTMDGKVRGSENNLKLTVRSCILVESTLDLSNKCYANVNSKIVADIKEQALINIVYRYQSIFSDDAVAGICSCSTDNCNGAINSVNVPGFFLVVSTFLVYFSKYL
ncbi:unnamed protein product [Orchesella dallaii]|uniref:Protein quiver n=1 Tax=Orchesella dallaii TaxID=48710 RepID=A0ABP1RLZ1_9HEXA